MYESLVLDPVAPLTCPAQASRGETALTLLAADRSSKWKAGQLIRLIIITSHVQHRDFWVRLMKSSALQIQCLQVRFGSGASTGGKAMSHKPNASDSYLFIHSVILPSLLFFFSWVPRTNTCVLFTSVGRPACLAASAVAPVDVRQVKRWSHGGKEFGVL